MAAGPGELFLTFVCYSLFEGKGCGTRRERSLGRNRSLLNLWVKTRSMTDRIAIARLSKLAREAGEQEECRCIVARLMIE